MAYNSTANIANALGISYAGRTIADPKSISAHASDKIYGQFNLTEDQNQLLWLTRRSYMADLIDATSASDVQAVSGSMHINAGYAGGRSNFILPAAAAGLVCEFCNCQANGMRITAATGDTITNGDQTSIAAGYIQCIGTGSAANKGGIKLLAVDSTKWIAVSAAYDWEVETA
jgi:hypothetical protein